MDLIKSELFKNVIERLFKPLGLRLSKLIFEEESGEYQACSFQLNTLKVIYRRAKITPKKAGQFVTLWKRRSDGPIEPFHSYDDFHLVIIGIENDNNSGQFVFPKQILIEKGIITHLKKEGKRGFRVYPSWDSPTSLQARKTQQWQLAFFLDIQSPEIDLERARSLYS